MTFRFGSKELCKALGKLGFIAQKQHSTSHQKYIMPKSRKTPQGMRPFITVIQNKKIYHPPTIASYIRQLKSLGFSEKEIINALE